MKSSLLLEQPPSAVFLWDEVQRDTRLLTEPVRRMSALVLSIHGGLLLLPFITPAQLSISFATCILALIIVRLCNALICLKTVLKPEGILVAYFRYGSRKVFLHREDIRSAKLVRLPLWSTPKDGPTYRVYGRQAIAVCLRDGRTVYIGTQEQEATLNRVLHMYN
jgi:hypothetical protein